MRKIPVLALISLIGTLSALSMHTYTTHVHAAECDVTVQSNTSIQQAVSAQDPGAVICIMPGTYHEVVRMTKPGQTLRAADPSNKPILDGKLTLPPQTDDVMNGIEYNNSPLLSLEAENITVQDIIVTRSKGRGIRIYSTSRPTRNILISGVTMSRSLTEGLAIFGTTYGAGGQPVNGTVVRDSIIEYNNAKQEAGGFPRGAGMMVKGVDDVTIDDTIVRYNWGEGILADSNWSKSTNVKIHNNVIHDNKAAHVYLHAIENVDMRNNLVYSSYRPEMNRQAVWGCVWIQGLENESAEQLKKRNLPIHGSKNILIENNLFAGCINSVTMGAQNPDSSIENITIRHNTFVNLGHKNGVLETDRKYFDLLAGVGGGPFRNIVINYNIFLHEGSYNQQNISPNPLPSSFSFSQNLWSSKPAGAAYTGDIQITGQLLQNSFAPLEAKPSNLPAYYAKLQQQFMPRANSQALNGGVGSTLQKDFFGSQRTSHPDIGAIELPSSTEPPANTPTPTPTPDVPTPTPSPVSTPTPTPTPDFSLFDIFPAGDPDGKVDTSDLTLFVTEYKKPSSNIEIDFNKNGARDIFDYNALLMEL